MVEPGSSVPLESCDIFRREVVYPIHDAIVVHARVAGVESIEAGGARIGQQTVRRRRDGPAVPLTRRCRRGRRGLRAAPLDVLWVHIVPSWIIGAIRARDAAPDLIRRLAASF